jgi:hypothetical protein
MVKYPRLTGKVPRSNDFQFFQTLVTLSYVLLIMFHINNKIQVSHFRFTVQGATTLSIITYGTTTISIKGLHVTLSNNDTQHDNALSSCCHILYYIMLNVTLPNVIMLNVTLPNVIMLNVIMLNVIMLNVIMLNVIMLNVIMLNVIMLNVIMLNVVAPYYDATYSQELD